MSERETFATEYEAHYRLTSVQEVDLHRWMSWCNDGVCRWRYTGYSWAEAREVALTHCREKHVRSSE